MDSAQILDLMRHAAQEYIQPRFRQLAEGDVHEKNPGDPVTIADRESEEYLTAELQKAFPGAAILGEEAYALDSGLQERAAAAEHVFTIDPVDGTRNFVAGSPDYAVMVAEVRGGVSTRGWIYHPEHNVAYTAEAGGGAWRDDQRLPTLIRKEGEPLRGASSHPAMLRHDAPGLAPLRPSWMSAGIDYPKLATGEIDFLIYPNTKPWDHIPGGLLVAEVGGAISMLDGAAYGVAATERWVVTSAFASELPQLRTSLAGALV